MNIILYNGQVWDSTWGHHKDLVTALAKEHQVHVIDLIDYGLRYAAKLKGKEYPVPAGVTIVKRRTKMPAGILFGIYTEFRNLWDLICAERFFHPGGADVIITYLTSGVILAVLLAKCLRKKIVLMYADDYAEFLRNKSSVLAWLTEHIGTPLAAKCCQQIIVTAHKLKDDLLRYNPHITVIPNGVHLENFQPSSADTTHASSARPFTVGFVGGFGNWVDFEMVLDAAKALPDIQFKLIGSGDQFETVSHAATTLPNVWTPGILPHKNVPEELATMDVCLIPFKVNRLTDRVSPVKLFEYWAMRKPVIATPFYEVQKIAGEKVIFVDNSDALQKAIKLLQNSPERRTALADLGFQEVRAYDWVQLGSRYLDVLHAVSQQGKE